MTHRNRTTTARGVRRAAVILSTVLALGLGVQAMSVAHAASIPAWLDSGITKWNSANPAAPLKFVDIKDSFVWYQMPKSTDHTLPQMREGVNKVVLANRYQPLDDEEIVTIARPPVVSGKASAKKCWSRSFVLNIQAQNDTKAVGEEPSGQRQRMLTSLMCDDANVWWAAFRVAD